MRGEMGGWIGRCKIGMRSWVNGLMNGWVNG